MEAADSDDFVAGHEFHVSLELIRRFHHELTKGAQDYMRISESKYNFASGDLLNGMHTAI